MKIRFLSLADKELAEAIVYYNVQLYGLGKQFFDEVVTALKFIKKFPQGWQKVGKHSRKYSLKRFPYLILYVVEEDEIIITALAHQCRRPAYYFKREERI